MTEANHTSNLEVYHSVLLKYCEKRSHFSHDRMVPRTALSATTLRNDMLRHKLGILLQSGLSERKERLGSQTNLCLRNSVTLPLFSHPTTINQQMSLHAHCVC